MAEKRRILFVCHAADINDDLQKLAQTYELASGSAHVTHILCDKGIDFVTGEEFYPTDIASKSNITIAELTSKIDHAVRGKYSEQLAAFMLSVALQDLTAFFFKRHISDALDAEIAYLNNGTIQATPPKEITATLADGTENWLGEKTPTKLKVRKFLGRNYVLDFRTISGEKLESKDATKFVCKLVLEPVRKSKSFWRIALTRFLKKRDYRLLRVKLNVPRLSVSEADRFKIETSLIEDRQVREFLERCINEVFEEYVSYKAAILGFFIRDGLPSRAIFNHMQRVERVAVADLLKDTDCETVFFSHGCFVPYGEGPRHDIVRYVGNAQFNSSPVIQKVSPRSPLQVVDGSSVEKVSRVIPIGQGSSAGDGSNGFKAYYAPNYVTWYKAIWGVNATCFDTLSCAEALAAAVVANPGLSLFIRVKTTARDKAVKTHNELHKGLVPEDVFHLFDPENRVFDACTGSHSRYMDASDVVVTEGVTAVMFEALENRKPVLLLNASENVAPSLPHWSYQKVMTDPGRNAVYAASKEDDLGKLLVAIKKKHLGSPLANEELEQYIWV